MLMGYLGRNGLQRMARFAKQAKSAHRLRNRMRRCFPRIGDFLQHMSASALRKSLGNLNQSSFIDLSTWV